MYKIALLTIVCVVLVLSVASLKYRKDMIGRYEKLESMPSKVYSSTYGNIEYLVEGEGPTILISHGITGGVDQGIGLAKAYVGDGYRKLYVSRFGYLKSAMPDEATARMQAAAYSELLDHLGLKSVFVLGSSAGGPSASFFAIDYPDKTDGLILLASAVPGSVITSPPPDIIFKSDFIYWTATKTAGNSLLKLLFPASISDSLTKQELAEVVDHVFGSALPVSMRSKGILFDMKISNPSVDSLPFEQIKSPTLIIHAPDDPAPPFKEAKKIAERINGSIFVSVGGGHLFFKHEDEVKLKIKNFIYQN
jgi:pimeloyl-ACP methyl ester carboxylesterase